MERRMDGWVDERMDDSRFYVLFNTITVISGQFEVDNERMCAMEPHLRLRIFRLERGSNMRSRGSSFGLALAY